MLKHMALGIYSISIALSFTVISIPAVAADFPTGSYESKALVLSFGDGKQWHLDQGKKTVVSGTYSVKGDQLEMTDVNGPWACDASHKTGTYTWRIDGAILTFTKVADACKDRAQPMTSMKWKRQTDD